MSKNGKVIQINPELRKAINAIIAEDAKIDQQKLIDKIKERKIPGLPEGVIRVGVKNYFNSNSRSANPDTKQSTA